MTGRFRQFDTAVRLDVGLRSQGPLLVKAGVSAPERPDLSFVRYPTPWGEVPFIPGSSLRGVLRSGLEALLRSAGRPACEPDPKKECAVDRRCPICLLFGSTKGAAALLVSDALPWRADEPDHARKQKVTDLDRLFSVRNGIRIDRATGTVAGGALFDYEVLCDATFYTSFVLRNPSVQQLGLLATGLFLLDQGVLRVGSGASRGLGRLQVGPVGCLVSGSSEEAVRRLVGNAPVDTSGLLATCTADPKLAAELLSRWEPAASSGHHGG